MYPPQQPGNYQQNPYQYGQPPLGYGPYGQGQHFAGTSSVPNRGKGLAFSSSIIALILSIFFLLVAIIFIAGYFFKPQDFMPNPLLFLIVGIASLLLAIVWMGSAIFVFRRKRIGNYGIAAGSGILVITEVVALVLTGTDAGILGIMLDIAVLLVTLFPGFLAILPPALHYTSHPAQGPLSGYQYPAPRF